MDRIIFGDNQFFGINHMSEEKAADQAERFQELSAVLDVIDAAYDAGIRGFMFSTHQRVESICAHFREQPQRYRGLTLYPVLPYPHKYAAAVAENGLAGAIKDAILAHNPASAVVANVIHGGKGIITQSPYEMMKVLLDAELKMFRGLNLGVVFLQNVVADLLLGMKAGRAFTEFSAHIARHYGAEAGFMTMNLPAMARFLDECGLWNPVICASVNKLGYLMNPSRESYEEVIAEGNFQPVCMSVLASGAISPREAVQYVCSQSNVRSIVFGASSGSHIVRTKALIDELWRPQEANAA